MELLKLLGILIVIIGFVLKMDSILIIMVAAVVTALVGGMDLVTFLETLGSSFVSNRSMCTFIIVLVVTGTLERNGLKQAAGLVAKFMGGRAFAILAGPIGWVLSLGWVAFDIAGPAYRVMIPCAITIAYLRMVYQKSDDELNDILK